MQSDDLLLLYRLLRRELEVAYAARPWDGERVDLIAEDLCCLERVLAARQCTVPRPLAPQPA